MPYIIIAQTKEKPEDKCKEKGNLIIKAYYGYLITWNMGNYGFFSEPFIFIFYWCTPAVFELKVF